MQRVEFKTTMPVPAQALYGWHMRSGAFQRLTPPWEPARLAAYPDKLADGATATIAISPVPGLTINWQAYHTGFIEAQQFMDVQEKGPFAYWQHTHRFEEAGDARSTLTDAIEYKLPLGKLGQFGGGELVRLKLDRMFRYRHQLTRLDLQRHQAAGLAPQTILVTGSSGLIGEAVCAFLRTGGHRVIQLLRPESPKPVGIAERDLLYWNPRTGELPEASSCPPLDAVLHLAGANVATQRWTKPRKQALWTSRVESTELLVSWLRQLPQPPKTFLCASGISIYEEKSSYLSELAQAWEAAAREAEALGCRVVPLRIGLVLSAKAGFLAKLWRSAQLGVVPKWYAEDDQVNWIHLEDVLGAILHTLANTSVHGPVNLVSPSPCDYDTFWQTLASALHSPSIKVPSRLLLTTLLGELAEEAFKAYPALYPTELLASGYHFSFKQLDSAVKQSLGIYTPEEALWARLPG